MATKIQLRRDTEANWNSVNPVLAEGEIGVITDINMMVAGDGSTAFADLPRAVIKDYVDTSIATHEADTTAVHGIADTTALVLDSDARLSDARTPTAHATTHATGNSDAIAPADIGAATAQALTDHEADTTAIHGITDTSQLVTQTDLTAHETSDPSHGADTVSVDPSGLAVITTTDVQAALVELDTQVDANSNSPGGQATDSGDGVATAFSFAHGLGSAPTAAVVSAGSADAVGDSYVTFDATNITVTYVTAPASGTNNLTWNWLAI